MTDTNPLVASLLAQARQFTQMGNLAVAAQKYRQLLAREPDFAPAHFELGLISIHLEQLEPAIESLSNAVKIDAQQANYHNILGIAYSQNRNLDAGASCFQRAIELDPNNPMIHNNLGNNFKDCGMFTDAAVCYQQAISLNPKYVRGHVNLAHMLRQQAQHPAAIDAYRRAQSLGDESLETLFGLATSLYYVAFYEEAANLFKQVVASEPEYPNAYQFLGVTLSRLGEYEEAIDYYHKAIELDPKSAIPHISLGNALQAQADIDGTILEFRQALALQPDHSMAHSNLLLAMNYLHDVPQATLFKEALQFASQQAPDAARDSSSFGNSRNTDRILKIGYVSADFRSHSVAHFTRKLIGAHDRSRFEVFCYANVQNPDAITQSFQAQTDHWLSIVSMENDEIADRIEADEIDILIDLSGHTADNRLLVFARRAAPIQVNWLGYPNTTGIKQMDYRLTDAVADPEGDADAWHSEKLVRLPNGFLCYQTAENHPEVSPPPCIDKGHVTFGSFNNLAKTTPEVIRVWSKILTRSPDSRLLIKSHSLADEKTRTPLLQKFQEHGIVPERLELIGSIKGRDSHLAAYSRVDIGLDPFPYNGTTTTFEAIWMGVPIISLRGDRHAGRVGASILHHAGLPELIAESEDEYVERAVALAADKQKISDYRQRLRPQLNESALMDTAGFTRSLEDAYRAMWNSWCDKNS